MFPISISADDQVFAEAYTSPNGDGTATGQFYINDFTSDKQAAEAYASRLGTLYWRFRGLV